MEHIAEVKLLQVMVMRSDGSFTLEEPDAAASQLGVTPHTVSRHDVLFISLCETEHRSIISRTR